MEWKLCCRWIWKSKLSRFGWNPAMSEPVWAKKRYEDLVFLDGKRLDARFQDQMRKRRMARYYNKRVDPKALKPGDLVLKQMKPRTIHPGGKFKSNWEGPFIVKKVFSKGR